MPELDIDSVGVGFALGLALYGLFLLYTKATYRNLLLSLAATESTEKLPDGNFYYIVPEKRYNEMGQAVLRDKAAHEAYDQ